MWSATPPEVYLTSFTWKNPPLELGYSFWKLLILGGFHSLTLGGVCWFACIQILEMNLNVDDDIISHRFSMVMLFLDDEHDDISYGKLVADVTWHSPPRIIHGFYRVSLCVFMSCAACTVGWWREWAVGESALKWTMTENHLVVWVCLS